MKALWGAIYMGTLGVLVTAAGCGVNPNRPAAALPFGVMADAQYAQKPPAMGRHYAESLAALQRCVNDFNQSPPAFVIQLGDFIDGGPNAEKELRQAVAVYKTLPMPHYHLLGNHDFAGLDRDRTMRILGLEQAWYGFDAGDWRFVVLDTQDLAVEGGWDENSERYRQSAQMLERLKAAGAPNAKEYNGGFSDLQLAWLDVELADAEAQGRPVIVFGHLPLMPLDDAHIAWNAEQAVAILEKYDCVKAYFCGHRHGGGYTLHNGIHYVTIEAMVDAADAGGAWARVKLMPDEIIIEGAGAVTSRTLAIR
ncbi:MAG: metallophosphoesterase [Planctomycetales bacterium]|nr:metallophosphoesterase [Planctomycetales bacterium]